MPPFKVLVAGGGPVGLTAALALARANIEFTVLEKYSKVVSTAGADLVLAPIGLRAVSQLGIFDEVEAVSTPLGNMVRLDHQGQHICDVDIFIRLKECFGQTCRVMCRSDLSRILYEALPEAQRANVLCSKAISSVETSETGVTATCEDGSVYVADMIIGADGVHSTVRSEMTRLMAGQDEQSPSPSPLPFLTTYQCLWVRFPTAGEDRKRAGQVHEMHGPGVATQTFYSPKHAVTAIYERLETVTKERLRLGADDKEALIKRRGHLPLTSDGKLTLRSAYEQSFSSDLVALEEGVVPRWSYGGRMVLAGDAAHKVTPITGAGYNNGVIDIAVLVNQLNALLLSHSATAAAEAGKGKGKNKSSRLPSSAELEKLFAAYQEERAASNEEVYKMASIVTATATWASSLRWFLDLYVMPISWVQKYFLNLRINQTAKTPCFDFLPGDKHVVGSVAWQTESPVVAQG